ncbi:MAG: 3-oxoacyl-[acyl-carrier-protein] synthase, KASII [uncultured Corynebacteriales bacterium]|uniref:3-oxoacyl-[acyl-carrier-protein] synthase, KASII n=1 Tax=uncultured Mycobacteriales bacterium TaxID=581187 RepID=A0A6J4JUH9_9ACTN|nr:MAG: 3-oxoacyl-[acyl-carrier-protein] synthase, KASII [uncultured Corynebacteriales bacterium]
MTTPATYGDPIAVTGMAWDTALGREVEDVWQLLLTGADGFREVPSASPVRNPLAARLADAVPDGPLRHQYVTVTAAVARRALADAGVAGDPELHPVLGTSLGPHADSTATGSLYTWAEDAGRALGTAHRPIAVSTACSAGSDALSIAGTLLRTGLADRCVAGGVDLLSPAKRLGHSGMGVMSAGVLRPFDADRDGTLPGEGAAFLVLERLSTARGRGARVHGILAGWGASNSGTSLNEPDASGAAGARAVLHSLAAGRCAPGEVACVSMHGTGTVTNDAAEAELLRQVFGRAPAPVVVATKGALGHTLGASGAIDTIVALLALRDQVAPPVTQLRTAMADFPLPLPIGGPAPVTGEFALNVTLGVGGFNTCLLLRRGDSRQP